MSKTECWVSRDKGAPVEEDVAMDAYCVWPYKPNRSKLMLGAQVEYTGPMGERTGYGLGHGAAHWLGLGDMEPGTCVKLRVEVVKAKG